MRVVSGRDQQSGAAGTAGRGLALTVILSAQLMVMLDFTIVNVALPSIRRDLGFSASGVDWVVTAYAITFGGLLILAGRIGDVVGRRRLFLVGLGFFSAASLVGGFSTSGAMLVGARAAQGVGAAAIAPTALALLTTTFAEGAARNRVLGWYGATASVGFVAGLALGGFLVTSVTWRAVFWVNVPIGIVAAVAGRTSLPPDGRGRFSGRPDVLGAVLVTSAMAALVYLPVAGSTGGWGSPRTLGVGLLAAALLSSFVRWERRRPDPLVRLGILRRRTLTAANVVTVLFGAWNAGEVLVLVLYLQGVLGYSPLRAGVASVPQGLAGLAAGITGARLADRFGIKPVLLVSTALAAVGHLVLSRVGAQGDYLIGVALVVIGFGNGATGVAATLAATARVVDAEQGLAGGLVNSSRQIGSALGVATLVSLATTVDLHRHGPAAAALSAGYRVAFLAAAGFAAVAFAVSAAFIEADGTGRANR